ncbi:MAG: hypothetical protein JWN43_4178 [Gammaproteobacteria bacterium]|nr:hypothetical protein [Gammaproteobacteria bacterium]
MDPNALRDQLMKLHEELGAAKRVEPRSNRLLAEIMEDIRRLMDESADVPAAPTVAPSLSDRLEKIAVQFEVDHPTLAASARRLVDMLGKAGL